MNDELDPERLRELLDAASRLPREVQPGRDAWPEIRRRIDAQRVRPRGRGRRGGGAMRALGVLGPVAPGGILLVVLTSRTAPRGTSFQVSQVPVATPLRATPRDSAARGAPLPV